MKNIKIIVATHKPYDMPKDPLYLPVHVGSAMNPEKDFSYQKDDEGQNISKENPYFCELTGLYWAWKNLDADYLGLCHYRRYFASPSLLEAKILGLPARNNRLSPASSKAHPRLNKILSSPEAAKLLKKSDIIVPKLRKYYIETLYDHYAHTMHKKPLDLTRKIIKENYPNYLPAFDRLKTRRSGHMFNMFIMKRDRLDDYCEWLFDILFALEKEVKKQGIAKSYDAFHARFYGRISELLLDVYLETNHLTYSELRVLDIEPVNWLKKGSAFLSAKFLGKKYEKSF